VSNEYYFRIYGRAIQPDRYSIGKIFVVSGAEISTSPEGYAQYYGVGVNSTHSGYIYPQFMRKIDDYLKMAVLRKFPELLKSESLRGTDIEELHRMLVEKGIQQ